MKRSLLSIALYLCLSILILGCSDFTTSDKDQNPVIPITLNAESTDVKITKEMKLLEGASDLFESSNSFNQVQAFVLNPNNKGSMQVKGEEFQYIKLSENDSYIAGEVILENNTDEDMNIESLFLQGHSLAKVKTSSDNEWSRSLIYNVPPFTSVKLDVHIEFNHDGMNELTFFPKELSDQFDRYNGGNIGSVRYFVLNEEVFLEKKDLNKQAFEYELSEANSEFNFHPTNSWIGADKKLIEYEIIEDSLIPTSKITGMLLDEVPYNTEADLLLIKDSGEIVVIEKDLKIERNIPTYINFEEDILAQMNNTSQKSYIMLTVNREREIISDLKVFDMNKKPFLTSYQSILEYHQFKD